MSTSIILSRKKGGKKSHSIILKTYICSLSFKKNVSLVSIVSSENGYFSLVKYSTCDVLKLQFLKHTGFRTHVQS